MSKFVLVDGNAIGYACHMGTKLTVGARQVQAIFGLARTMRIAVASYPGSRIIVLWDGKATWRELIYPAYKGNRADTPDKLAMRAAYKAQHEDMEQVLRHLGIEQVRSPLCEADDLAGAFTNALVAQGRSVSLVTSDTDWMQLVQPGVTWFDPIRDRRVSEANFVKETDLKNGRQFLEFKALKGDSSDNIRGVGGIGEGNALKLLTAFGSVDNFVKLATNNEHMNAPKAWMRLTLPHDNPEATYPLFERNMTLMDLSRKGIPGVDQKVVTKGKFDPAAFKTLCEDLNFRSIFTDIDLWLDPFKR